MNKNNSIWASAYWVLLASAFFPFFHDHILCPLTNIGIRGGDGSGCGLGWLGIFILPYQVVAFLVLIFVTIAQLRRAHSIKRETGSKRGVYLYSSILVIILGYVASFLLSTGIIFFVLIKLLAR